jgi:hypothetical protein
LVNRVVHVGADLVAVIHSVLCEGLTPLTSDFEVEFQLRS